MLDELIKNKLTSLALKNKLDLDCPRVLAKMEERRLQITNLILDLIDKQTKQFGQIKGDKNEDNC